jgi:hypothetical protein
VRVCLQHTQGPKLVEAAPALLAMQPHTLAVKLQRLQAIAATHPAWAQAYSSLPPKSLAILLTYSLDRHARLSYAVARGMQDRCVCVCVLCCQQCVGHTPLAGVLPPNSARSV